MLSTSRTLLFTFVFALTLLIAFAPQVDASASPASPAHRRQAGRMVKKRQLGIIGVGEDPGASSTSANPATQAASAPGGNTATETGTTSTGTATAVGSATGAAISSDTLKSSSSSTSVTTSSSSSTISSSSSSSTATSSSSSSSTTVSSSSVSLTSSEALSVTAAPDVQTSSSDIPTQTFTSTLSNNAAESSATESANATSATSSSISKTTITVIAVVAGCVGGAAIIWTIIRKWKFRPSAEFEDRMQPIDWSPEATHSQPELGLHRSGSNASHGSFHSGSDHDGPTGPRPYDGRGNSNLVSDIPPHDFTAGPALLGGGYADLTRGPSPGPQMAQTVARGPSFNHGYGY